MTAQLAHNLPHGLDPRFVYDRRNPPPQIAAQVEVLLTGWKKANPRQLCHIIAYSSEHDGMTMPFLDTFTELPQGFGAVAIVIPDRLAYCYAENNLNKESQYILFRPTGLG